MKVTPKNFEELFAVVGNRPFVVRSTTMPLAPDWVFVVVNEKEIYDYFYERITFTLNWTWYNWEVTDWFDSDESSVVAPQQEELCKCVTLLNGHHEGCGYKR
jgi:hypothetical protein